MSDPTHPDSTEWKVVPFEEERRARGVYYLPDGSTLVVDYVMQKIKMTGKIQASGHPEVQFQVQNVWTLFNKNEGYLRLEK